MSAVPTLTPGEARGILYARAGAAKFGLSARPAAPALAPLVERYWIVTWDLRGQEPYPQRVLPAPVVNLTFGPGAFTRVTGVDRGVSCCVLAGSGRIFGVRFRPGGFHAFLRAPVSSITDRHVPIPRVFGAAGVAAIGEVRDADRAGAGDAELARVVDRFLCGLGAELEPAARAAAELVEQVAADRGCTRVDGLARLAGVSSRTLQRLFATYVGVSPKWVIRRYRIHEAARRVAAAADPEVRVDWTQLAVDLGYCDQAHFTRDFTAMVGTPPDRYARDCAAAGAPGGADAG